MQRNTRSVFWAAAAAAIFVFAAPIQAARPDAWITTKAKIALLGDPDVHGLEVNVDTVDGRVTLHGDVATAEEKAEAERIVRGVEGVTDVRNMLALKTADAQPKEKAPASAAMTDDAIEQRVEQVLDKDAILAGKDVDVESVDAGVVTLDGELRTMSEHRRAMEKARAVDGVKAVRSNIEAPDDLTNEEVWEDTERTAKTTGAGAAAAAAGKDTASTAGSAAKDMWITSATKVRLMANDKTPAMDINVDTRDGQVTLFGSVPSAEAKQAAETEAQKVNGVIGVRNELEVVAPKAQEQVEAKDEVLKDAVNDKIAARAELKDDDVNVEVSNGVARLTGTVDSQTDRMSALTTARSVPGIRSAIDDLKIDASDVDAAAKVNDGLEANRDTDAFDGDAQNDAGDAPLR
jgi:osmotically-inducible protein OsmY